MMRMWLCICCLLSVIGCSSQKLTVKEVISADTVLLSDGKKLKYAGVSAPTKDSPWFEAAKAANEFLVLNHEVHLVKEPQLSTDRTVTAYVYTPIKDQKSEKQLFVNAELIRFGYARADKHSKGISNIKLWQNLQEVEEKEAKLYKLGVWSGRNPEEMEN